VTALANSQFSTHDRLSGTHTLTSSAFSRQNASRWHAYWRVGGRDALRSELVTQDEDLQLLGGVAVGEQGKELDGAAERQVGELRQHSGKDQFRGLDRFTPHV
jgi:hypothetical protein